MTALVEVASALAMSPQVVETACRLTERLLGKPCDVAGELLADTIYGWQVRNRLRIIGKVQRLLEEKGVSPRIIPEGFLVPLLRDAGNVDQEHLQDLWAQLLASAVADDEYQHPGMVNVLSQMTVLDARLYELIVCVTKSELDSDESRNAVEALVEGASVKALIVSIRNLVRLGLCNDVLGGNLTILEHVRNTGRLELTTFGAVFAEAVTGKRFPEAILTDRLTR